MLVPVTSLIFGIVGCIYAKEMIVRATAFLGGLYISLGLILLLAIPLVSAGLFILIPILFFVFTGGFTYAGYKT